MIFYVVVFLAIVVAVLAILSGHQDIPLSDSTNNKILLVISILQFLTVPISLYCMFTPDIRAIYFLCLLQLTVLILLFTRLNAMEDDHRNSIVGDTRAQKIVHWVMFVVTFIVLVLCAWQTKQNEETVCQIPPTENKDPSTTQSKVWSAVGNVAKTVGSGALNVTKTAGQGVLKVTPSVLSAVGTGVWNVTPSVLSALGNVGRVAGNAVMKHGPGIASRAGSLLYSRFTSNKSTNPDPQTSSTYVEDVKDVEEPSVASVASIASIEIETKPHCRKYMKDGKPSCQRVDELGTNDEDCIRLSNEGCRIKKQK